jgi:hypothetical protein
VKLKRFRQENQSILGLDSLMDVVTNIIGALFFVIIYAVLTSFDLQGKINTPIFVTSDTKPIIAECRNNTLFFPEEDKMLDETVEFLKRLIDKGVEDWQKVAEALNQTDIKNKFYHLRMDMVREEGRLVPVIIFKPIKEARGEDELEITKETSSFQQALSRLNPQNQHIFFYVREESISIFHLARNLATQRGFKVGWEPFKSNQNFSVILGDVKSGSGFDPHKVGN